MPANSAAAVMAHRENAGARDLTLFDIFKLEHKYNLAAHRSHSSHGSHGSHRSSSGGGYSTPRAPVVPPPSRNFRSTPPQSILPSPPAATKVLPGNSAKFKSIVMQVQTGLYAFGYYTGAIDGQFGPELRAALTKFQKLWSMNVTGTITPEVLNALGIKAE